MADQHCDTMCAKLFSLGILLQRRGRIERSLLAPRALLHASLLERHLGTQDRKRTSPAFYLVRSLHGRPRFKHVRKADLPRVRREVLAWQCFQQNLAELREIHEALMAGFRRLAQAQEDPSYGLREQEDKDGGG